MATPITTLNGGYGGDGVSDEDVTGVTPLPNAVQATAAGTVGTTAFVINAPTTGYAASGSIWLFSNNANLPIRVDYTSITGGGTPSFNGCTCDPYTVSLLIPPGGVAPTWAVGAWISQVPIKIPRSKAVIGASAVDGGDVSSTNPLPAGLTDGSHGIVTVKPASTAAAAADVALVTAPSPNTSGPVQVISPSELAAGLSPATVFPAGFLRVSDEATQLLYDPFDGSSLDTNNWQTAVSSGGGTAAAVANGSLTLGTGTTASGYSYLQSQNNFRLTIPGWMGISHAIQIENPVNFNTYRFWGQGTVPATPTPSSKTTTGNSLTNGIGWELGADQKLLAVVWAAGSRSIIADLSASTGTGKQPSDGLAHRYICYIRTDKIFWYIDSLDVPVATSNFQSPGVQTLPDLFLAIAGTTAPTSSGVITCLGMANWDTSKNSRAISDGTYAWRKSTIKPSNTAPVPTDTAIVAEARPPSTPAVTGVAASTSSVLIKAANANRRGLSIFNQSTSPLYLLYGTGSATAVYGGFTVVVWPQSLYELPNQCGGVYTGALQGIWTTATGGCSVTEVTP